MKTVCCLMLSLLLMLSGVGAMAQQQSKEEHMESHRKLEALALKHKEEMVEISTFGTALTAAGIEHTTDSPHDSFFRRIRNRNYYIGDDTVEVYWVDMSSTTYKKITETGSLWLDIDGEEIERPGVLVNGNLVLYIDGEEFLEKVTEIFLSL